MVIRVAGGGVIAAHLITYGRFTIMMESHQRSVRWMGKSRRVLKGFPGSVRWTFGRALYKAQIGKRHRNVSPLRGPLRGVLEVVGSDQGSAFRLYFTLKCAGYVDVLFVHQKKSKRGIGIPGHEEALILSRLKARLADCGPDSEET
jgi:phage-related protein